LSDPELRRWHPEAELPPLHIAEEAVTSGAAHEASGSVSADQQMTLDAAAQETAGPAALGDGREPDAEEIEARTGTIGIQRAGPTASASFSRGRRLDVGFLVDPSGRPQLGFEAPQFAAPWSVAVACIIAS
jgi:hypothetical protein